MKMQTFIALPAAALLTFAISGAANAATQGTLKRHKHWLIRSLSYHQ